MPSPIAHLGMGYAIYGYSRRKLSEYKKRPGKLPFQMILIMGLSLLPDLDVIAAMIFRDMQNFHNNFSHSLLMGIPVAVLIAAILRQICHFDFWLWIRICLISYDLHIVMDALTTGRGVMMFWPLYQNRFASPIKLFYGLHWGFGWFSIWHFWTILTESLFVLVIVLTMKYSEKRRNTVDTILSQEK